MYTLCFALEKGLWVIVGGISGLINIEFADIKILQEGK
jgi:hypothetical protein